MKSAATPNLALRAAGGHTPRVKKGETWPVIDFVDQGVGGGRHCGWVAGRTGVPVRTRVTRLIHDCIAGDLAVGCAG